MSPAGSPTSISFQTLYLSPPEAFDGVPPAGLGRGWQGRLRTLAGAGLGLLIITLPWRQRLLTVSRPRPPIYPDYSDLLLFTHDVLLLVVLVAWALLRVRNSHPLRTGPFFIWAPLLGLVLFSSLSTISSADPLLSAYHALHRLLLLFLYLFLVNEFRRTHSSGWAFALLILVQAPLTLSQAFRQKGVGLTWLGEKEIDLVSGATVWAEGGLTSLRAYGLSDHPNILAINLALSLALLVAMLPHIPAWQRKGLAVVMGLGAAALMLTFSSNAWTALVAAMLLAGGILGRERMKLLWRRYRLEVALVGILLLPLIGRSLPFLSFGSEESTIAARMEEHQTARSERMALNALANRLFAGHALLGVGIGAMPLAAQREEPDFAHDFQPASLTMLDAAAETGLFGAMFYLILLVAPWIALVVAWRRSRVSADLLVVSSALLVLTLFSLRDAYSWSYASGRVWQWLLWGLWGVAYELTGERVIGDSRALGATGGQDVAGSNLPGDGMAAMAGTVPALSRAVGGADA